MTWKYIFDVLQNANRPLDKHEIASALPMVANPEQVRALIKNMWDRGNYSIYAERNGNKYVYQINFRYYTAYKNGLKGV